MLSAFTAAGPSSDNQIGRRAAPDLATLTLKVAEQAG
jgi:hypothetical protein